MCVCVDIKMLANQYTSSSYNLFCIETDYRGDSLQNAWESGMHPGSEYKTRSKPIAMSYKSLEKSYLWPQFSLMATAEWGWSHHPWESVQFSFPGLSENWMRINHMTVCASAPPFLNKFCDNVKLVRLPIALLCLFALVPYQFFSVCLQSSVMAAC